MTPISSTNQRVLDAAYRALHADLRRAGLLDLRYGWYAGRILLNAVMLAGSLLWLTQGISTMALAVNAVLLGFVMVQIGFIGHDAQHGQIVRNRRFRRWIALIHWNLLTGLSHSWWQDKHGRHHVHTNVPGKDPDLYPVLTFSRAEALQKSGLARSVARHQIWWYVPLLGCVAAYFRILSIGYLLRQRPPGFVAELVIVATHHAAYFGFVFNCLSLWPALSFICLNYLATGLYMGAVFSTNHLAMPLAEPTASVRSPYHQLAGTRNIKTGVLGDFLFGGLNYQIEHHLFPALPRPSLRKAARQTRAFCRRHGVPYHQSTAGAAYRAIARDLHDVGAPLRTSRKIPC